MIFFNTPSNIPGKIYNKEELQIIADVAIKNDLLVMSDEVYEFLTYDNHEHIRIASLPNMFERTLTVINFKKKKNKN